METREIKFRGLDINGNWHIGKLAVLKQKSTSGVEAGCYISNSVGMPFAYQVRPETVGQFVEEEDDEYNEVFDGDIVMMNEEAEVCPGKAVVITYFYGVPLSHPVDSRFHNTNSIHELCCDRLGNHKPKHGIAGTVIGNRHENPELITDTQ